MTDLGADLRGIYSDMQAEQIEEYVTARVGEAVRPFRGTLLTPATRAAIEAKVTATIKDIYRELGIENPHGPRVFAIQSVARPDAIRMVTGAGLLAIVLRGELGDYVLSTSAQAFVDERTGTERKENRE